MTETTRQFKPEIGKTFKLRSTHKWRTIEGEGTEVNISEFRIYKIDEYYFEYELVRTISIENPLPGTEGQEVQGGGSVHNPSIHPTWLRNLVD